MANMRQQLWANVSCLLKGTLLGKSCYVIHQYVLEENQMQQTQYNERGIVLLCCDEPFEQSSVRTSKVAWIRMTQSFTRRNED